MLFHLSDQIGDNVGLLDDDVMMLSNNQIMSLIWSTDPTSCSESSLHKTFWTNQCGAKLKVENNNYARLGGAFQTSAASQAGVALSQWTLTRLPVLNCVKTGKVLFCMKYDLCT